MKCIVKKLKESVNNPNLPILEKLEILSYVTTTQDGQYCKFTTNGSIIETEAKLDIEFEITESNSQMYFIASVGTNSYIEKNKQYIVPYNTSRLEYYNVKVGTVQKAGIDLSNGYCYVDDASGTCTSTNHNTWTAFYFLFARNTDYSSKAGLVRIRKVTVKGADGEHIFLPCKKGREYGFIDLTTNQFVTEYNGGELIGQ